MTAQVPRKEVGWKHEVEQPHPDSSSKFWTVWGPALAGGPCYCTDEVTANTIAAALNFAHNFHYVRKRIDEIAATHEYFQEFK